MDTATRVDQLVKQFRRRYPDAVAVCGDAASRRGDGLDWPDWCWLPMAAVHAYTTSVSPLGGFDIGKVAALTEWRLGRGVYQLDDEVAGTAVHELWDSAGGRAVEWERTILPPLEGWAQLPEWCCYVAWPEHQRPATAVAAGFRPAGVFVHLEHDFNTGRPELRLLIDNDGTWDGLVPVPVYLDRPNLGAAISDAHANAAAVQRGIAGANLRSLEKPDGIKAMPGLSAWLVLPLALALIDPVARHVDRTAPADHPRRAERAGKRWAPAQATRTWTITYNSHPTLRVVR